MQCSQGWDGNGLRDSPGGRRRSEADLGREVSQRVISCCSHWLIHCPCRQPRDCTARQTGTMWRRKVGARQEKLFPASAHLYFLLIANCSGKIISGAHTAAWTTEVLAVTCPHSGLVHRWQFFGKTEDPTETCIGSSYFVLLLCLNFLWFASPFKNSQQSITILWCIIIWRSCVLFWEEFKSSIH